MVTVGKKTYYFDKKGRMVCKKFVTDEAGNRYYFGKYGTMVKSKTVKIDGKKYTFDEDGIVVTSDNS